jgi:hypothetical protein
VVLSSQSDLDQPITSPVMAFSIDPRHLADTRIASEV